MSLDELRCGTCDSDCEPSNTPTLLDRISHNTTGKELKERIKDIDPTQPKRKEKEADKVCGTCQCST
ncbi:hypothetical protein KEM48_004949 [Puccinia striiformis f. sp. tritici PST-130]|nr:hypothetical protein KEM48_005282 [Puccinia striiformis f. sp. tritici PST-130]KAI9617160.1 hypothetical protein KEM48_004949 [Puccinia striiformis f. sp. tritici PST-130]